MYFSGYYGKYCENAITKPPTTTTTTPTTTPIPCDPVNNCTSHYTCNPDGTKKCLPGWTGSHCDQLIPDSAADCAVYDCK